MKNLIRHKSFDSFFYSVPDTPEHRLWKAVISQAIMDSIYHSYNLTYIDLNGNKYTSLIYCRKKDAVDFLKEEEDILEDTCCEKKRIWNFLKLNPKEQYKLMDYKGVTYNVKISKVKTKPSANTTYRNRQSKTKYLVDYKNIPYIHILSRELKKNFFIDIVEKYYDNIKSGEIFVCEN